MIKKIIYILLLIPIVTNASDNNKYGWDIPHTPLNIGGYLDMSYDNQREDAFLFNDIALLFFAHKNRFSFVGEIELSNISLDGKSNRSSDVDLYIERLELGYDITDTQNIKIGRFNSKVGYWNQAPISILQNTTTSPHAAKYMFPQSTTGIEYGYQYEDSYYGITLQHNTDIGMEDTSFSDNDIITDRHISFSYYYENDTTSYFISSGIYREENLKTQSYYAGIGFEYTSAKYELQAELFTQQSNEMEDRPYSGYMQSLLYIDKKQDVVLRFESYKDNVIDKKENNYLLGYVYRPWKNMVFKTEYIYHQKASSNQLSSSISVLF